MSRVSVVISIAEESFNQLSQVAEDLRQAGLEITQVLEEVGVITGECAASRIDALSRVRGVEAVEQERIIQLPPPESDVQ